MYDLGFLTRYRYQNNLKDRLAKSMIDLIKNTLDKNSVWLRMQEKYR